jgi:DUF4097 and DUF4098 domain-containing protein YvlB
MKNLLNITLSALLYLVAATGGPMAQAQVLVDVTKTFPGIDKIEVSGGSLEVEYIGAKSGNEVSVEAYLESNNPNQDIIFVTLGNVLKISDQNTGNTRNFGNIRTKGHIKIRGPEAIELDVKGGSGKINVENVTSDLTTLAVGSGSVSANNLTGNLDARSGSGSLNLENIEGDVICSIGSGSANINGITGSLSYRSGSGSVKASNVVGLVDIALTSGNARLDNIGELGNLKVSSGSLRAENAGLGPNTNMNGSSGSFRIQTSSNLEDFNYSLRASSGSVKVGGNRSGKNLEIKNGTKPQIRGSISSGMISIEN